MGSLLSEEGWAGEAGPVRMRRPSEPEAVEPGMAAAAEGVPGTRRDEPVRGAQNGWS